MNPNTKDEEGNPLLWLATKRGHQEVVETLLEAGADVNAVAPNGFTALHRSASEGFQGITEALLRGETYVHDLNDSSANPHHIRDTSLDMRERLSFTGFPLMTSRLTVIFPFLYFE